MIKHYHLRFYPKLGHFICAILRILCACVSNLIFQSNKQALFQHVTNCTYWPVLVSYNNCNIIYLTPKATYFEAFDEVHKVVLDRISENVDSLVQSGMYGALNTDETKNNYSMSFNSSQRHIHYKIVQQLMDKLFLLVN